MNRKRLIYILLGPALLGLCTVGLKDIFGTTGAEAIGVALWMIFWWITRPVHITVTAIVPPITNAFLNMIPMASVLSNYSSESIVLVFASGLIICPWAAIGLDRRIALKVLSIVGPSMKSQTIVWLSATVIFSCVLPNIAVVTLFCPIAVAMLKAAGYDDIAEGPGVPIMLAITSGVSLGGGGTPIGGAMNQVAISALQEYTGKEFMYSDWLMHIIPYTVLATVVMYFGMRMLPMCRQVKRLEGTKEFFKTSYAELGPMRWEEKFCLGAFVLALILAFTRSLYADLLPGLAPAYSMLTLGFICFFVMITSKDGEKKPLMTWEDAQKGVMWGMMLLFASGMAMGSLLNGTGASEKVAELISGLNLDGGLMTIIVLVVFTRIISEVTNGTTAAAVTCPIVFSFTEQMGLNPIPYWFICTMAYNAEFLLPISVRAVPIGYGLDPKKMLKGGIPLTIMNMAFIVIFGYLAMNLIPGWGELPYMFE